MKKRMFFASSLLAIIVVFTAMSSVVVAQAQTFQFHHPSFGLYCENENAIQGGTVDFSLADFEPTKLEASSHSRYQIKTEVGKTEHFSIPFVASACEAPEFQVSANGAAVEGRINYGSSFFDYMEIDLQEALQSVASSEPSTEAGLFYSISPSAETVELTVVRESGQRIIPGFRASRSSHTASGTDTFTLEVKGQESSYNFFVIGEEAEVSVVGAELEKESLTCKDYVDRFYGEFKEYYDEMGGVPVEFFYSELNGKKGYSITMDDLFFDSFARLRFMTYDFSIVAEKETFEIEYEQKELHILANARFSPSIYMIEQRAVADYSTTYTFSLVENYPFLLESSSKANKSGSVYSVTEKGKDFHFVFCSEAKPTDLLAPEGSTKWEAWQIACFCVAGVGGVVLCICVAMLIRLHIKSKKK